MKTDKQEIPDEVWWAAPFVLHGVPCGTTIAEKCIEIIKKYPQHFPWEAKYYSLPEEVHTAYKKEMGYDFDTIIKEMKLFEDNGDVKKVDGGLRSMVDSGMSKEEYDAKTVDIEKTIRDFFEGMRKMEENARQQAFKRKKVWDKHYKKYKLSFRPDTHERRYF